jgi:hypothetical protein
MSAMTDYLEGVLIQHIFRTGSFAKPSGLHVALFTSPTTDAGSGTEASGGSYARAAVAIGDSNWSAPSSGNGATANANAVTFPAPTANWGTITHCAIFDAPTGGNMLFHGPLSGSKVVNSGDAAPSFPAGTLQITLA